MAAMAYDAVQTLAQGFVQYYYPLFDVPDGTTRANGLAPLYDVNILYLLVYAIICNYS